ncbi:MAG: hypothetical protein WBJ87_08595 [Candidatus Hydrothermia bacterium]
MDTELRERLRELTIKRAKMEADDPALMLVSNPTHTMICSEISSLHRRLAVEYTQALEREKEVERGTSHNRTS